MPTARPVPESIITLFTFGSPWIGLGLSCAPRPGIFENVGEFPPALMNFETILRLGRFAFRDLNLPCFRRTLS